MSQKERKDRTVKTSVFLSLQTENPDKENGPEKDGFQNENMLHEYANVFHKSAKINLNRSSGDTIGR